MPNFMRLPPVTAVVPRRGYFKPLNFVTKLAPCDPSKIASIPTYRLIDNAGGLLDPKEEPKVCNHAALSLEARL